MRILQKKSKPKEENSQFQKLKLRISSADLRLTRKPFMRSNSEAGTTPPQSPVRPRSHTYSSPERRSRAITVGSQDLPFSGAIVQSLGNLVSRSSMNSQCQTPALDRTSFEAAVEDNDTHESYLQKITCYKDAMGIILCQDDNEFKLQCLADYLAWFDFTDDPVDMALRKLLVFVKLPKEAQQIDRLLFAFARVYHAQNQWFESPDEVYYLVFSLLILHTDFFNPNNKLKMTKADFVALHPENRMAEYYYDNITSQEFGTFDFSTFEGEWNPMEIVKSGKLGQYGTVSHGYFSSGNPYWFICHEKLYLLKLQEEQDVENLDPFPEVKNVDYTKYTSSGIIKSGMVYRPDRRRFLSDVWKPVWAVLTDDGLFLFEEHPNISNNTFEGEPLERFSSKDLFAYEGGNGEFVVVDATTKHYFKSLDNWVDSINYVAGLHHQPLNTAKDFEAIKTSLRMMHNLTPLTTKTKEFVQQRVAEVQEELSNVWLEQHKTEVVHIVMEQQHADLESCIEDLASITFDDVEDLHEYF